MGAANTTDIVGGVFFGIVLTCVILFCIITFAIIYFVIKYNHKWRKEVSNIEGNLTLEVAWTIIPVLIVLVMFYYGTKGYERERYGPPNALVVTVTGRQWAWSFSYPNGAESGTLMLPVDTWVRAETKSLDVIHSFYIPAFRMKQDVVPGRVNHIYFRPQKIGSYYVTCAEYCGLMHAHMTAPVKVVSEADFQKWYQSSKPQPPPAEAASAKGAAPANSAALVAQGEQLSKSKGCVACHSMTGATLIGPGWKGMYGHPVTVMTNGQQRTITADDDYIQRSILDPNADVVKGFPASIMPPQKGLVTDSDIQALIAYMKSLK